MKHTIRHGATLEIPSVGEIAEGMRGLIPEGQAEPKLTVSRPSMVKVLDATGGGTVDVYDVPVGYTFELRRIFLNLDSASAPGVGNVLLNQAAAIYLAYLRSGTVIEYANPASAMGVPSIPGAQSWGDQQGPFLRNGEIFQVQAAGLTANATLAVYAQGILRHHAQVSD